MTRRIWIALVVGVVLIPAVFSYLSPGGNWGNAILGHGFTAEADPGSFYVISAHELVNPVGHPLFVGHPGIPLQALLHVVQRSYFLIAGGDAEFAPFVARHLETVYVLSKVAVSAFSLASIWIVFTLAQRLGLGPFGATAAALGYATCFPFLFYISRISVESQAVCFGLGSWLCLFAAEDSHGPTRRNRSTLWMAACGCATALALLTKLNQTAILVVLMPIGILISNASRRLQVFWFAAFAGGAGLILLAASPVMDWSYFLSTWSTPGIDPGAKVSRVDAIEQIGLKLWSVFANLSTSLGRLSLRPQAGFNGMFNLLESVFITIGLIAGVLHVRRQGLSKRWLLIAAFVAWTLLMWWYRGTTAFQLAFHYLFFFMALMAVCFGSALESMARALQSHGLVRWVPRLLAVALFVAHGPSLWAFVDTRIEDVKGYRRLSREMFAIERQLPAGSRAAILLIDRDFAIFAPYQGLDFSYATGKTSNLQAALPMTGVLVTNRSRESVNMALEPYDYVLDLVQGMSALGTARLEPKDAWVASRRPLRRIGPIVPARVTCDGDCVVPDAAGPEFNYRHAFDGNAGTTWYSYPQPNAQTLVVDIMLPGVSTVGELTIANGPYDGLFAQRVQLLAVDGDHTTELAAAADIPPAKAGAVHVLAFGARPVSHLRLLLTTGRHPSVPGYQFGIAEITVKGYVDE